MALNEVTVKEYIQSALGIDTVAVELSDNDLTQCVAEAMRNYSRFVPLRNRESQTVQHGGIRSFVLPIDCYAVVDVEMQNPLQVIDTVDATNFNIFNNWMVMQGGYGAGYTGAEDYQTTVIWREMTGKVYSLDPDYYIEEDVQFENDDPNLPLPRKIHFYNPTGLPLRVGYIAVRPRPIEQVSPRDHDWIMKYALAHGKEILARKRGKVKVIPTAGQPIELDWAELREESREDKMMLTEELRSRTPGTPPIWG